MADGWWRTGAIGGLPGVVGGRAVPYPPSHNPPSLTIGWPCHGGRRSNADSPFRNLFHRANKHEPQRRQFLLEREIRMTQSTSTKTLFSTCVRLYLISCLVFFIEMLDLLRV